MKATSRDLFTALAGYLSMLHACAQFFPTEQAAWCLSRNTPEGEDRYTLALVPDQDTVIQGHTYMVIEYTAEWPPTMDLYPFSAWNSRCYVRNDDEGRGYLLADGMDAEVLVGDIDAPVGTIIQDIAADDGSCGTSWEYGPLTDMIVDSIVDLSENGLQARRLYVTPLCSPGVAAALSFWQTDLGTPFGPFLMLNELSRPTPECAAVNDTTRFWIFEELQLGGPLCSCYDTGLEVPVRDEVNSIIVFPNPSRGSFLLHSPNALAVEVHDPLGRLVLRTNERELDLSEQAPGVYTALIQSSTGRQTVRLVVER